MPKTTKQVNDELAKERKKHEKTIMQKNTQTLIKHCLEDAGMAVCTHNIHILEFYMSFCLALEGKMPPKEDLMDYISLGNKTFKKKYHESPLYKALND